jgi:hypothetical protein
MKISVLIPTYNRKTMVAEALRKIFLCKVCNMCIGRNNKNIKIISHRGNLSGPCRKDENSPKRILEVLRQGFDVEADVWWTERGWFLGHDFPRHSISRGFLSLPGLWCHAKNQKALVHMLQQKSIHCFWHQNDDYTITSRGLIWAYPGKKHSPQTIVVCKGHKKRDLTGAYGLCTDYPVLWAKRNLKKK